MNNIDTLIDALATVKVAQTTAVSDAFNTLRDPGPLTVPHGFYKDMLTGGGIGALAGAGVGGIGGWLGGKDWSTILRQSLIGAGLGGIGGAGLGAGVGYLRPRNLSELTVPAKDRFGKEVGTAIPAFGGAVKPNATYSGLDLWSTPKQFLRERLLESGVNVDAATGNIDFGSFKIPADELGIRRDSWAKLIDAGKAVANAGGNALDHPATATIGAIGGAGAGYYGHDILSMAGNMLTHPVDAANQIKAMNRAGINPIQIPTWYSRFRQAATGITPADGKPSNTKAINRYIPGSGEVKVNPSSSGGTDVIQRQKAVSDLRDKVKQLQTSIKDKKYEIEQKARTGVDTKELAEEVKINRGKLRKTIDNLQEIMKGTPASGGKGGKAGVPSLEDIAKVTAEGAKSIPRKWSGGRIGSTITGGVLGALGLPYVQDKMFGAQPENN